MFYYLKNLMIFFISFFYVSYANANYNNMPPQFQSYGVRVPSAPQIPYQNPALPQQLPSPHYGPAKIVGYDEDDEGGRPISPIGNNYDNKVDDDDSNKNSYYSSGGVSSYGAKLACGSYDYNPYLEGILYTFWLCIKNKQRKN